MGVTMFDFLSDKLGYHTKLYVILPGCVNQGKKAGRHFVSAAWRWRKQPGLDQVFFH